jgi:hypothetical protein
MGVALLVGVVVLASFGWATDVSGDITTDTTWRAADSPFIIRNDISVRNNATLTIEAGVVVRFAGYFTLTIQSGSRLVAQGQADRLIQFIPDNEAGAGPSAYRGIVFENGSTGLMAFCVVDRAHDGVTILSSVNEGEVTLRNCTFQRCGASGVAIYAFTVIRPVIEGCTFQDSTYGVFCLGGRGELAAPRLRNNTFRRLFRPVNFWNARLAETLDNMSGNTYADNTNNFLQLGDPGGGAQPIVTDFTWRSQTPDGLPIVIGNLQVGLGNRGVLRIPAGTTIPILANGFIRIGIVSDSINSTGTIIAEGTSDSPIVFRPLTPSQRWNAIQYETPFGFTPSSPSRLVHCIIEGAGTGIVVRRYAQDFLTVSNCTIRQCGTGIFTFEVGFPTIDGCRIENCDTALRVATRAERGFGTHLARLPTIRNCTITNNRLALSIGDNFPYEDLSRWDNANNTITDNEQNIALMDGVTFGATPSSDIPAPDYTWRDTIMGLPVVVSQLVVEGRVIIPAGTTVRSVPSGQHGRFQVVSRRGVLVAQGTAANPIRFTCTDPSLQWSGLEVFDGGTAELENCIIERALTAIHPFDVTTRYSGVVTVRNCTITDGGTGIYDYRDPTTFLGQHSSLTVENTTFRNLVTGIVASPRFNAITGCRFENLQVAIRLRPSTGGNTFAADDLNRISNNTYINNAVNIVFGGHTDFLLKASLTLPSSVDGQPLVLGSFRISPNTALTVPAGATVLMKQGAQIIVEGGLQAVGTADAPIRFVPAQPINRRDWWVGFAFANNGTGQLEHCLFEGASVAVQNYSNTPPTLRHCTFRNNGTGIGNAASATFSVTNSLFNGNDIGIDIGQGSLVVSDSAFFGNAVGVNVGGSGNATIRNSMFVANAQFAVRNDNSNVTVDAKQNWWNSPNGPRHPSNPQGDGDTVSDRVDFSDWLTNAPANSPPAKPTILAPLANSRVPTPLIVKLTATDPDIGQRLKFKLELSTDNFNTIARTFDQTTSQAGWNQPNYQSGETALFVAPNDLPAGTYQLRAYAIDNSGVVSPVSEVVTFELFVNQPPTVPELISPADNAVVSPTPTFTVKASDPEGGKVRIVIEVQDAAGNVVRRLATGEADSGVEVSVTLPADQALASGTYRWRAKASDGFAESDYSAPQSLRVQAATRTIPAGLSFVTLPFATDQSWQELLNLAPEQLRVATWVASQNAYAYASSATAPPGALVGPPADKPAVGRGFWVKLDSAKEIAIVGRLLGGGDEVVIDLPVAGWHSIGYPFNQAAQWDINRIKVRRGTEEKTLREAQIAGWMESYAWGWQPNASDPNTGSYFLVYDAQILPGVVTTVEPFAAYWVRTNVDNLKLVFPSGFVAPPPPIRKRPLPADGFALKLTAQQGSDTASAFVGMGQPLRAFLPPTPPTGSGLQISVLSQGQPVAADVKGGNAPKASWELLVRWQPKRGIADEVTLTFDGLVNLPKNVSAYLVDTVTGKRLYLRTVSHYRFTPQQGETERRFQLLLEQGGTGVLRIVNLKAQPMRGQGIVISFSLTKPAQTTAEVLTLTGRRIAVLEPQQTRQAGAHQLVWRSANGLTVVSGIYLVRMTATDDEGRQVQAVTTVRLK